MRRTPLDPRNLEQLAVRMTEPLSTSVEIHALLILGRKSEGLVRSNAGDEDMAVLLTRAIIERGLADRVRHLLEACNK